MAVESAITEPSSSTSTGTLPVGLRLRNSSRRSQVRSIFISKSSFFSAITSRTLRDKGDSQR